MRGGIAAIKRKKLERWYKNEYADYIAIVYKKCYNFNLRKQYFPFEMKQPRFNLETEAAMEEARLIMEGKISARTYILVKELFDELKVDDK